MVAITAIINDLEQLVGKKLPRDYDGLNEILYSIKCEVSSPTSEPPQHNTIPDDYELQIENVDTNRPDTWSPEGIARAISGHLGIELGLKKYRLAGNPATEITVDPGLEKIRPFIGCVVARHPTLGDNIIRGLIHLQEKLDQSYGRRRKRSSIGFYDFGLITPPLTYGLAGPDEIKFVPLEGDVELTLREIIQTHPKGIEYGHIVSGNKKMPILLDAKQKVLSFPPVINSNDLGKLTPDTKDILVEVTGTNEDTVLNCLTILATALADRGAQLCPALVRYRYGEPRNVRTPTLQTRALKLPIEETRKLIGLEFGTAEMKKLLRHARYDVPSIEKKHLTVSIPCYRLDILHPVDVMEDVAMAYGLNRMKPKWPSEMTLGGISGLEEYTDRIRELAIGFGFQEVLTFIMTNEEKLFTRMNQRPGQPVQVSNPKVATMTCLRSWLLPSLMDLLSNNTHVEYPQRVFEVGDCTIWDASGQPRDVKKLTCVSVHAKANFTEMKSCLEPLLLNLGHEFSIKRAENPSFLEGRAGIILIGGEEVGIIGEVHPQVIENWKLEDPVASMELDVTHLFNSSTQSSGEAPQPPTSERAN